jgi:hypothetical protein
MFNRSVSLLKIHSLYFSRGLHLDSLVSIVSKLRAGRSGVRLPAGARDFSFYKPSRRVVESTESLIQLVPGFFSVSKAAGASV